MIIILFFLSLAYLFYCNFNKKEDFTIFDQKLDLGYNDPNRAQHAGKIEYGTFDPIVYVL
jgi:hypothetical protein